MQRASVRSALMDKNIPGALHKKDGPWAQKRCKKSPQRWKIGIERTK